MFRSFIIGTFLSSVALSVNAAATFAGSAITSDSSGTRSILVSSKNGGGGVIQTRTGGGGGGVSVGSGAGTYQSPGGGVGTFAGPAGAYAGPGGAYANAGFGSAGWDYPYWNAYYPQYDTYSGGNGGGGSVGVYSSSDGNGIQGRFASVGPGGQATIVEQVGNEAPRVYTYRGADKFREDYDN